LIVGVVAVASFAGRERDRVDEQLMARPAPDLARALGARPGTPGPLPGNPGGNHETPGPGLDGQRREFGPRVLRPAGEYFRLISGGDVVRSVDAPTELPVPDEPGLRTLSSDGSRYRSLAREVAPGTLIEIGINLDESEARIAELRDRLILIGLAGVLLVAALSWWLAGLALRPLGALRDAAGRVSGTDDLSTRIDPGSSPAEIEELTESINAMLARLEISAAETGEALEATRRFAGDAGHELRTPMTALQANLGAVRRNPDLDPAERAAALEQMEADATRMMRMLATLQTLARGDSAAALPREQVEMTALAGTAVESARSRHSSIQWRLDVPPGEVVVEGWPDGLRAMIDNLLENAARHGRSGGEVSVALGGDAGSVRLTVDDEGDGVPTDQRERIFDRFERGDSTGADGSGLGLSLVRQQARLHGGEVTVGESPAGGARFRISLLKSGSG
ncbi:MAG: sensor histidine kinase, partial [Acidobacteriota bacterium]